MVQIESPETAIIPAQLARAAEEANSAFLPIPAAVARLAARAAGKCVAGAFAVDVGPLADLADTPGAFRLDLRQIALAEW